MEHVSAPEQPDTRGDDGFQRFLDDAVHKAPPATENNKPGADRQDPSSQQSQSANKPVEHSTASRDNATNPNAAPESLNKINPTQQNSRTPSPQELASVDHYQQAIDHLKELGFDTDTINALLEFLNDDSGASAAALLQSLTAHLSQLNDTLLKDFLADSSSGKSLLTQQQNRQDLVTDLLKQAGLTDQEAQDLIQQIQSIRANKSNSKDGLMEKARTTSTEDTVHKPEVLNPGAGKANDDSASKQRGGEKSESKTDIFSQLDSKTKASETTGRSSIEKLLTQESNQPQQIAPREAGEKVAFQHATLEKSAIQNNLQGIGQTTGNAADTSLGKGPDALKAHGDFQIQNINATGENAQKTASTVKAALLENPIYKAPVESRVIDQIVNRISMRSSGSQNEVKVRLDPPSLGTVRMNISSSGDGVRTVIVAENHAVKQVIENNLSQLRDSMTAQGLKIEGFTVLVGGEGGSEFGGQNDQFNQTEPGFSDFMNPQDPEIEPRAEPVSITAFELHGFSQRVSVFA
ncbi:hypothetical protein UR09_01960 [Candidatus Nitromaritima sp. SCGC AAA799-A02]|nr:hypothetical protein UR09_01960 [Candidatus Nitromaritima sp. SCGC AAA799-A02]